MHALPFYEKNIAGVIEMAQYIRVLGVYANIHGKLNLKLQTSTKS